jgi:hypothetical protein
MFLVMQLRSLWAFGVYCPVGQAAHKLSDSVALSPAETNCPAEHDGGHDFGKHALP